VNKDLRPIPDHDRVDGAEVVCDLPNNNLEHFEGTYTLSNGAKVPLTARNLLLRGCMLRNTDWVLGAVVYTGKESKIQMNAVEAAQKVGSIARFTNRQTVAVFCLQLFCCLIGGIVGSIYVALPEGTRRAWYLWRDAKAPNFASSGVLMFFRCCLGGVGGWGVEVTLLAACIQLTE